MGKVMVPVEDMSNLDESGLKRDLRLRHMVMIAISGTIGTGLFLTSGKTIATAGPLGARKFHLPRLFVCCDTNTENLDKMLNSILLLLVREQCCYSNCPSLLFLLLLRRPL